MDKENYIAYVGTYTHGSSLGIHIYDLDVEAGTMKERKVVPVNNASYITKSHNGKYLYTIADEGVEAFRILPDGDLECINTAPIGGMRGCYLSIDAEDRFLFVGGYHDGRVSVMRLNGDGSIAGIADGVFHKGMGSVAERNFRPHVNCVIPTPDQKYLCAVDLGLDHVKIYRLDHETGKLRIVDFLRCELESAPRHMKFSEDGRFAYLICELRNIIHVYSYDGSGKLPVFELIQTVSTVTDKKDSLNAAAALKFTPDNNYLICSNAGEDSAHFFKIDRETGLLEDWCNLPVSGDYPKDVDVFPDGKHLISLNHESNSITLFKIDYEKKYFYRHTAPLKIETPNCILVSKVDGE